MEQHFEDAWYILQDDQRVYRDEVIKHTEDEEFFEMGELVSGKLSDGQMIRDIAIRFEQNPIIQNEGLAIEAVGSAVSVRELKVSKYHSSS